ncbi:phosphatase PAP2 family protein [Leptospira interrogans]
MVWAIIAVIVGIDAVWAWSMGIKVELNAGNLFLLAEFIFVGWLYATIRSNEQVAAFAAGGAQLVAFTGAAGLLSYLMVASAFPLIDNYLAAADAALGFDWLAMFMWVHANRSVEYVLFLAYNSGAFQMVFLILLLPALEKFERLRELVWLIILSMIIILPLSWLFPAESAWVYFGVTDRTNAYHLSDFTALRAGRMPEITLGQVNGLVTFPSFHTAFGVIMIYVTRGIRFLFAIFIVLNILLIASTPVWGGHYLVDVLAGLAVVPLAVTIMRWARHQRPTSTRVRVVAPDFVNAVRD